MNNQTTQQPIVCIDLKKNRIRVHKVTLHLLGDPDCIQLLVNPESGILAIRGTIPDDHLGLKIHKEMLTDGNCYEIHSKHLLQKLRTVREDWQNNCSYRIYGKCDPKARIAQFPMKDIVLIEDTPTNE
jgi:hypothetical protein